MIRPAIFTAMLAVPAMAEEPPVFAPGPVTASEILWLFDAACLVHHPDFNGADAILDGFGFTDYETVIQRQHPWKELAIMVAAGAGRDDDAATSCAVSGTGLHAAAIETDLRALIQSRLDEAEPTAGDKASLVWTATDSKAATTVFMAEHSGVTFLVASVVPHKAGGAVQ